ncbi:RIP metalloprotease RseP [Thermodesulfobacteriota bacterium]
MLTTIFAFVAVLGVLIFFHELGHFLVAMWMGVGVEKFSLGFGPRLFGKKIGVTDYRISAIPLGGYVKMVGEEPDAEIEPADIPLSFTHKHVFKRILIVAAGPLFNLLLAVLIYFCFFQIFGITLLKPFIRNIHKDSIAQSAGFKKGDLITGINDSLIKSWNDINKIVEESNGQDLTISVLRGENTFTVNIRPELKTAYDIFGDEIKRYDIGVYGISVLKPLVGQVKDGSPAYEGGLKKGDLITAINGNPVETWNEMAQFVNDSNGETLSVSVNRGETVVALSIKPEIVSRTDEISGEKAKLYMIGISASSPVIAGDMFTKRLNPIQAFWESVSQTYEITKLTFIVIGKLFQGDVSTKTLGGPIMIAQMAGEQAREGIDRLISFIALISINLAILNFLPIPVLDGGHIFFFVIEAAIGRPVNVRVREIAQQGGIAVLLLLMIFVFYNDIIRIFSN